MILHLASFTWVPGTTATEIAELTRRLREMAEGIPELAAYRCGENLRLRAGGADYGVAALVSDRQGLDRYLDSEAHASIYADLLGRMIEQRSAVQIEVSAGAQL